MSKRYLAMLLAVVMFFTPAFAVLDDISESHDEDSVGTQIDSENDAEDNGGEEVETNILEDEGPCLESDKGAAEETEASGEEILELPEQTDPETETEIETEAGRQIESEVQNTLQVSSTEAAFSTAAQIQAALDGGIEEIIIANDIELSGTVLQIEHDVVFRAGSDAKVTLFQRADETRHMMVGGSTSVIFDGIILDGAGKGGGIEVKENADLKFSGLIIQNCAAVQFGGAIYIKSADVVLSNSRIENNSAFYGGGIYLDFGTLSMDDVILQDNSAAGSNSCGGAMYIIGDCIMTNVEMDGNTAHYGGGIYVISGTAELVSGIVQNNNAAYGGGIYTIAQGQFVLSADGEIKKNVASSNGGGICTAGNYKDRINIRGGIIEENQAKFGGGIYVTNGVVMDGGIVRSNTGGGVSVYSTGEFTLNGGSITLNTASGGAGINVSSGTLVINGGEIAQNTSTFNGAGVSLSGTGTMNGGIIRDNVCYSKDQKLNGAGLYVTSGSSTFVMNGGEISSNEANGSGGGIAVQSNAKFILQGGKISNNIAAVSGGGAYIATDKFGMSDGEISGNSSELGGGIFVAISYSINLSGGSILSNNAQELGGGIYLTKFNNTKIENINFAENIAKTRWTWTVAESGEDSLSQTYINAVSNLSAVSEGFTNAFNNCDIGYDTQLGVRQSVYFELEGYNIPPLEVNYRKTYNSLPVIVDAGQRADWYLTDGKISINTSVDTLGDHTLRGGWSRASFVVAFDTQANSIKAPDNLTVYYGTEYGELPAVKRTGYTFDGWFIDKDYSQEITQSTLVDREQNHTLYAKWSPNEYTIRFDTQVDGLEAPLEKDITYDSVYGELPSLSRAGYTFSGWFLEAGCKNEIEPDVIVSVANNHTLFAGWQANRYEVAFDTQTDSVQAPEDTEVVYDAAYGSLPQLQRIGYTFEGWSLDREGEYLIEAHSVASIAEAHTLYAQWSANTYVVSFEVLADGVAKPADKDVVYDNMYGNLPVIKRTGYVFAGWYLDEGFQHEVTDKALVETAENHTLFARWLAEEYTLSFDSQAEGILNPEAKEIIYEAEYGELPLLSRLGYTFIGWAIDSAGEKLISSNSVVEIADNHTAYAVWEANKYKVSFVTGTKVVVAPVELTFDSVYGMLPVLERSGYSFGGWFLDEALTEVVTEESLVKVADEHNLYAKWTKNSKSKGGNTGSGNTTEKPIENNDINAEEDTGELNNGNILLKKDTPYIAGYDDATVRPDASLTRAETAVMLQRLLAESHRSVVAGNYYVDISRDAWYADAADTLTALGVMKGYEDGSFRPEKNMTRGEFATVISRFINSSQTGNTFVDLPDEHWAADNLLALVSEGWLSGYPDGSLRPEGMITRAEAVKVVNGLLGRTPEEEHYAMLRVRNIFSDLEQSHWAYYEILEAIGE